MDPVKATYHPFTIALPEIIKNKISAMLAYGTDQVHAILLRQLHKHRNFVVLVSFRFSDTNTNLRSLDLTLRNIKSSARSATQSCVAVHFPIPPFAANLVQRARSPASI
jgi:hypothetical protein